MNVLAPDEIKCAPCPQCALCGNQGEVIYVSLQDRLFGAKGSWNLKRCINSDCGLVWPDPMPLPEEIGKAYANYYTHAHDNSGRDSRLKQFFKGAKRYWLSQSFGYPPPPKSVPVGFFARILYLLPPFRNLALADVRYLRFVPGGKLLDVGCGSGSWLAMMRDLGWIAEGVDFDSNAVALATAIGLNVKVGSLEDQRYPSATFDAITLNHVIEHVPDPVATIEECARLLKPGGKLILFTPNAASYSHCYFKQDWRGLEPPRHLHIFTFESARKLFARDRFLDVSVKPDIGTSASFESSLLKKKRLGRSSASTKGWRSRPLWRLFSISQHLTVGLVPKIAECLRTVAVRK